MTTTVVLASRNPHKIEELGRILADAGLAIDLVGVEAFPEVDEVAETGETFAANALLKARAVAEATGLPAVGDDSGLCVDALNGMPGIFSARWSGGGGDLANLELLLAQLAGVPPERRAAHFVCAAAVAMPDGRTAVVEGRLDGHVITAPRGTNGFGYDPVFVPVDDPDRTTAELTDAAKDAISHRGRALRVLAPVLADLLAPR
ncbi:MAG TPA: RdgB/HAM1 family non-canonical purine NTP pyrophosphatase [Candidatus Limnocylindria bacterium]|nr:RdgB/HAM1 family non-canonical purine NTP pyrophosphatase [Candidatus Limnocylindria bacterium]